MRILFLNYEYPPLGGGAGQATQSLFKEFSNHSDIFIDFVTSSIDSNIHTEPIADNIVMHRLPIGKNKENLQHQSHKELLLYTWKAIRMGRHLMNTNRYDLIHAFFSVPCGFVAQRLSSHTHIPYIVSLRGADVPGYAQRFSVLYKIITPTILNTWNKAARVVSNSEGLKTLALKSNPNKKIDIIPNGIDCTLFSPGSRTNSDRNQQFKILSASRLTKRKGIIHLLKACHSLNNSYPHLHLTIAGGQGDASKELQEYVVENNLEQYVTFSGAYSRDHAPELYKSHDAFVLPSLNEGMSNALLEAMASGLPVLMTPTGGAKELIEHGINGYLLEYNDSESIEQALKTLLENDALVESMGAESRKKAEHLRWSHIAQAYKELYCEVLKSKASLHPEK